MSQGLVLDIEFLSYAYCSPELLELKDVIKGGKTPARMENACLRDRPTGMCFSSYGVADKINWLWRDKYL